jgi:hypothetical protein
LLLIEGHWSTGSGMSAAQCEHLVREHRSSFAVRYLDNESLWGRRIEDERYPVVSTS